jgi:hypothetical protein
MPVQMNLASAALRHFARGSRPVTPLLRNLRHSFVNGSRIRRKAWRRREIRDEDVVRVKKHVFQNCAALRRTETGVQSKKASSYTAGTAFA